MLHFEYIDDCKLLLSGLGLGLKLSHGLNGGTLCIFSESEIDEGPTCMNEECPPIWEVMTENEYQLYLKHNLHHHSSQKIRCIKWMDI